MAKDNPSQNINPNIDEKSTAKVNDLVSALNKLQKTLNDLARINTNVDKSLTSNEINYAALGAEIDKLSESNQKLAKNINKGFQSITTTVSKGVASMETAMGRLHGGNWLTRAFGFDAFLEHLNTGFAKANTTINNSIKKMEGQTSRFGRVWTVMAGGVKAGGNILGGVIKAIMALFNPFLLILAGIGFGMVNLWKHMTEASNAIAKFRRETDLATAQSKPFEKTIVSTYRSYEHLGVSADQAAGYMKALVTNFNDMSAAGNKDITKTVAKFAIFVGVGAETSSKLLQNWVEIQGMTGKAATDLMYGVRNAAQMVKLEPGKVIRDISEASEEAKVFFTGAPIAMAQAALNVRRLGIGLNDAARAARGLLNFEESITAELEASVLAGKRIDLTQARLAAFRGDVNGSIKSLIGAVGGVDEFMKKDVMTKEAIAKAAGMTTDSLMEGMRKLGMIKDTAGSSVSSAKNQLNKNIEAGKTSISESLKALFLRISNLFEKAVGPLMQRLMDFFTKNQGTIIKIFTQIANVVEKVLTVILNLIDKYDIFGKLERGVNKFGGALKSLLIGGAIVKIMGMFKPLLGIGAGLGKAIFGKVKTTETKPLEHAVEESVKKGVKSGTKSSGVFGKYSNIRNSQIRRKTNTGLLGGRVSAAKVAIQAQTKQTKSNLKNMFSKDGLKSGAGKLGSGLKTAGKTALIGGGLMIGFALLSTIIGGLINGSKGFQDLLTMVQNLFSKLVGSLKPAFEVLVKVGQDLITQLAPVFEQVITSLMPVIMSLVTTLMPVLVDIIKNLAPIFGGLVTSLMPVIVSIIRALAPILKSFVAILVPVLKMAIKYLVPAFLGITSIIMGVVGVLSKWAANILYTFGMDTLGNAMMAISNGMWDAGKAMAASSKEIYASADQMDKIKISDTKDKASSKVEVSKNTAAVNNLQAAIKENTKVPTQSDRTTKNNNLIPNKQAKSEFGVLGKWGSIGSIEQGIYEESVKIRNLVGYIAANTQNTGGISLKDLVKAQEENITKYNTGAVYLKQIAGINDGIVKADGTVIPINQADNVLAMKSDPMDLIKGKNNNSNNIVVNNDNKALINKLDILIDVFNKKQFSVNMDGKKLSNELASRNELPPVFSQY